MIDCVPSLWASPLALYEDLPQPFLTVTSNNWSSLTITLSKLRIELVCAPFIHFNSFNWDIHPLRSTAIIPHTTIFLCETSSSIACQHLQYILHSVYTTTSTYTIQHLPLRSHSDLLSPCFHCFFGSLSLPRAYVV